MARGGPDLARIIHPGPKHGIGANRPPRPHPARPTVSPRTIIGGIVAFLRPRLVVAFDASSVCGAVFARGLGRPRLRVFARVDLPPLTLAPSPVGQNLARPDAVTEALVALRRRLGTGAPATLVMPHGVGRLLLTDAAADTDPRALVRFRLASSLPYPPDEAMVDVLPLGGGRLLGAAVRRSVVAEYESVATAAGFAQEGVDLAPLVALAGLARRATGVHVHVIMGDAALSLAAFRDNRLLVLRTRLRDPGPDEAPRLFAEAERTALLSGDAPDGPVTFVGPGARGLVSELLGKGCAALLGALVPEPPAAAEAAWLGGMLA